MLNPAIDRRVVDCDAAFGHHRFEIPVADRVPAVLAHSPEHDLTAEVASLEITHAPTPRSSQRRQFTDSGRFLQQSHLQHTAASHAVMSGANLPLVGKMLEHRRHRTTVGYAHLADGHLVEAAEKVRRVIAEAMVADTILSE